MKSWDDKENEGQGLGNIIGKLQQQMDRFIISVQEYKDHEEQKMIIDSESIAKMMELNTHLLTMALKNEFRLGVLEGKNGNDSSHEEIGEKEVDKIMELKDSLDEHKKKWEKQHREWNLKKTFMEEKE